MATTIFTNQTAAWKRDAHKFFNELKNKRFKLCKKYFKNAQKVLDWLKTQGKPGIIKALVFDGFSWEYTDDMSSGDNKLFIVIDLTDYNII